ncbi:hypothetical protein H7I77_13295 [Mycolicibacterium novocastrense]|nr:hypothetical protein [Mycolicibacterium novocastrense]MCV7024314.1 hypothetical protein [Mycolicibacterium novocastrense]
MAITALFAVMMLLSGALRALIQRRRTGEIGNRRTWRPDGSLEWWALAGTDLGYHIVGVGAPLADLAGLAPVIRPERWHRVLPFTARGSSAS